VEVLLGAIATPYPSEDATRVHPIDLAHTSRVYKTLLQGGHFSHVSKSVMPSPSFSGLAFASDFLRVVGKETTVGIAKGDGSFVVAELCGRIVEGGNREEKERLKAWFGKAIVKEIEDGNAKGKRVLLEKLALLSSS
jgi:pumilio homology domain family member 6